MENEEENSADNTKTEPENILEKTLTEEENPSDNEEVEETPSKRQKVNDETEQEVNKPDEDQAMDEKDQVPKAKPQSSSGSSVKIVEVKDVAKKHHILKSISSSCNNSQTIEIKNKLGIGAKNEEFSFNDGNMQDNSQSIVKSSQRGGLTLRVSPQKKKKKSSASGSQKPQNVEEVDILTESSNDKEIKKHTSGNDGPSWTKSY